MRDRLINIVDNALTECLKHMEENNLSTTSSAFIVDRLIENGVGVPPVKVGDTVYTIYEDDGINPMIEESKVIDVSTYRIWIDGGWDGVFTYSDIGRTVFLTREAAEQALFCNEVI